MKSATRSSRLDLPRAFTPGALEPNSSPAICAEGYLFEFERRGYLSAGPFVPEIVLDRPELVEALHREFVHAGSDVVEAFTCNRYEVADFAREALELGVRYLGLCCGAGPQHVRAMAEAVGRGAAASRYTADMTKKKFVDTPGIPKDVPNR